MKFAVIGGDMRNVKLAKLLSYDGHTVKVFAQDKIIPEDTLFHEDSAFEAEENADCIILPLPVTSRDDILNAPFSSTQHTLDEILMHISPGQIICGGRLSSAVKDSAVKYGLTIHDYFAREELAVRNADVTAEGALQILMEELPVTINGSKCLVLGYGRIGKILAGKLSALGAKVTVSARNYKDMAWISACGFGCLDTRSLKGKLSGFDAIINTIPASVLTESLLKEVGRECFCLDLASKPGGIDFSSASRLGIKAVWALGLPGEVAPETSGAIIKDTIYNIIYELGLTE